MPRQPDEPWVLLPASVAGGLAAPLGLLVLFAAAAGMMSGSELRLSSLHHAARAARQVALVVN